MTKKELKQDQRPYPNETDVVMGWLKIMHKYNMRRLLVCVLIIMCIPFIGCFDPRYGAINSSFKLAEYSRLPKWVTIPQGYSRSDLNMTITFYTPYPFGKPVRMVVYGPPPDSKVLMNIGGTDRWHPYTVEQFKKQKSYNVYPNYTIISVDGVEEVFEHKRPDDILSITDDPPPSK